MALKKFADSELILNHQEAWQVLIWFFGGNAGTVPGWLTSNDRSFAQALLVEAVDASYTMSWIQTLMTSALKPNASITGILAKLALKAAKEWIHSRKPSDFKDAKIYKMIKDQLTLNWRSAWQIRIETGEAVY